MAYTFEDAACDQELFDAKEKAELQAIIQKWDDNGDDLLGRFDNLVDALWHAGYRRVR